MTATVLPLTEFKNRRNPNVIHVGDVIEFEDWTGEPYRSRVVSIVFSQGNFFSRESAHSMPLVEKGNYILGLEFGQSIIGDIVTRKIVSKAERRAQ